MASRSIFSIQKLKHLLALCQFKSLYSLVGLLLTFQFCTILIQDVERALQDTASRYTRTRAVIMDLQASEEQQKVEAAKLQDKLKKDQERYEVLKTDANENLVKANTRMIEVKKAGENKILKLRALLKKEEMRVKSLELENEKKAKANEELTQLCDELCSKVSS